MTLPPVYCKPGSRVPYALLRRGDEFGIDVVRPSSRFWADEEPPPLVELGQDVRRLQTLRSPAQQLTSASGETWSTTTRQSVARVFAWFLIAEDRQRRLTSQRIDTLAHQASVVQHVFSQPSLRRVLLADEVGLGKTVEAGLMVRNVLSQSPSARILYLAPARLVRNVRSEFDRLDLQFRSWVASQERDASLSDSRVIASIHRAAHENRVKEILTASGIRSHPLLAAIID